jgi:hypothetical protein
VQLDAFYMTVENRHVNLRLYLLMKYSDSVRFLDKTDEHKLARAMLGLTLKDDCLSLKDDSTGSPRDEHIFHAEVDGRQSITHSKPVKKPSDKHLIGKRTSREGHADS